MDVQDGQAVDQTETGAVTVGLWPGIKWKKRVCRALSTV